MRRLFCVVLILLAFSITTSCAQETDGCKAVNVPNPHPMDMIIQSAWVGDSAHFTVTAMQPMPFTVKNGGMIPFDLCLIPHDGKSYSTKIFFKTNMGTFSSVTQTMQAALSGVSCEGGSYAEFTVFPNPSTESIQINIPELRGGAMLKLYSGSGEERMSLPLSSSLVNISVASLANGRYFLSVEMDNDILYRSRIIVKH